MIDNSVNVLRLKTVIANILVGVDVRSYLNVTVDMRAQSLFAGIRDNVSSSLAVAFKQAHHSLFARAASTKMLTLLFVHVASKTTHKSLINFNVASELVKGSG